MASDKGGLQDGFDERLAAARDSALIKGEKVIAQEEGDQGQGIILTDSRVLVIKVGLTATGTSHGSVIGAFPVRSITAVNLRKGPLGEVIQICADRKEPPAEAGAHPDNVIVFTGSQRMKRCEAIAAELECLIGKSVSRSEPRQSQVEEAVVLDGDEKPVAAASMTDSQEPAGPTDSSTTDAVSSSEPQTVTEDVPRQPAKRTGRPAVSLADEMFAEMMQSQSNAAQEKPSVTAEPVRKPAPKPVEPAAVEPPATQVKQRPAVAQEKAPEEPSEQYAPNPNLPRPLRRGRGRERVLVVFGVLGAVLITGIAIMAPMRAKVGPSPAPAVVDTATTQTSILRKQVASVEQYLASSRFTVQRADRALVTFDAAARSGNRSALAAAAKTAAVDDAWHKLSSTPAPRGLAGAQEQMVSGMFIAKNALANAAGAESSTGVTPQEALNRTREARVLINRGLNTVVALRDDLHNQIRKRAKEKPSQ